MLRDARHARVRSAALRGAVKMATEGKRHQGKGDEDENPYTLQDVVLQPPHGHYVYGRDANPSSSISDS